MYYINIFFIYSFLGFIFENVLSLIMNSHFNSGVLYGPWTFIYGFAIFFILGLNKFLNQFKIKKWVEIILFFLGVSILMTLLEFSGGMLIEKIFHRVYWDYSNMKFNYGHYICLEVAFGWGLFATFINYVVAPHLNKLAKKIPKFITLVLIFLFVLDCMISFTQ